MRISDWSSDVCSSDLYADGWVDDARLVALNALDSAERGATIATHTEVTRLSREAGGWLIYAPDRTFTASPLLHDAGPFGLELPHNPHHRTGRRMVLVPGSPNAQRHAAVKGTRC